MILLLAFQATGCSGGDKVITIDELPAPAKALISKYFGGKQVTLVKKDKEGLKTHYDVMLSDGTKLEFDKKGEWRDIKAKPDGVPTELVPTEIRNYVNQNYPGQKIIQIDRIRSNYEIDLSNELELKFNKRLELIGIDD